MASTAQANIEFYRERAADMLRQSADAVLPSVRERCDRAAAAWGGMIAREEAFARVKLANARLAVSSA